jgi:hypothetical protein
MKKYKLQLVAAAAFAIGALGVTVVMRDGSTAGKTVKAGV